MYNLAKALVGADRSAPGRGFEMRGARRRFATAVVTLGLCAAGLSPAAAAPPEGRHRGQAYGTSALVQTLDILAGVGTTAFVGCPCVGTNGVTYSNSVAGVSTSNNVLNSGAIHSTSVTKTTSNSFTDELTSKISNISLLGGLITADAIVTVARTTATATSVASDDIGSSFVNLKVLGQSIAANVKRNTVMSLPGIGTLTLRQTARSGPGADSSKIEINAISISVLQKNSFNLPIGARVIAGHAASGFQRGVLDKVYFGKAFATSVNSDLPNVLTAMSGRTANISVPCVGTAGKTNTAETLGVSSGLVRFSGASTTAYGDANTSRTTSTLAGLSALNGLITATSVKSVAETKLVGNRRVRSTAGTGFVGLRVLGLPIPVNVPPNTQINLPGIGYVVINGQSVPSATAIHATSVIALQIFITKQNLLGLPIGANIELGNASAGINPGNTGG